MTGADSSHEVLQLTALLTESPEYWPLFTSLPAFAALQASGWALTEAFMSAVLVGLLTGIISAVAVTARKKRVFGGNHDR